jgi:hypothetical protein
MTITIDRAAVEDFLKKLEEFEKKDTDLPDKDFQYAFKTICDLNIVTEEELAQHFMVGKGTIDRWKRGVTASHPLVRKTSISYLKHTVSAALR